MAFTHFDPGGSTYRERQSVHFSHQAPEPFVTCTQHPELPEHPEGRCVGAAALARFHESKGRCQCGFTVRLPTRQP